MDMVSSGGVESTEDIEMDIKSLNHQRFWSYVDKRSDNECWNWTGGKSLGYGKFAIRRKMYRAHRISYCIHNGEISDDVLILHHCDNPSCVNPAHLYEGTHKRNTKDASDRNRLAVGIEHGNHKLTEEEVRAIRIDTRKHEVIAQEYGISRPTVGKIKNRRLWQHLHQTNSLQTKSEDTQ